MREYVKKSTCRAAWFPGHSRALSLYRYLYTDEEYIIFILGTFTMHEYAKKSTTRQAAQFPGCSRLLSLQKYLYIDNEYIIFILDTYTMTKNAKKKYTLLCCLVSWLFMAIIALKGTVH